MRCLQIRKVYINRAPEIVDTGYSYPQVLVVNCIVVNLDESSRFIIHHDFISTKQYFGVRDRPLT